MLEFFFFFHFLLDTYPKYKLNFLNRLGLSQDYIDWVRLNGLTNIGCRAYFEDVRPNRAWPCRA